MPQIAAPSKGLPPQLEGVCELATKGAVPYGTYPAVVALCDEGAKTFHEKDKGERESVYLRWWFVFDARGKRYGISVITSQRVSLKPKKRPSLADIVRAAGGDPNAPGDTDAYMQRGVALTVRDGDQFAEVADVQPLSVLQSPALAGAQARVEAYTAPSQGTFVPPTAPQQYAPPQVPAGSGAMVGTPQAVSCILCAQKGLVSSFPNTTTLATHVQQAHAQG